MSAPPILSAEKSIAQHSPRMLERQRAPEPAVERAAQAPARRAPSRPTRAISNWAISNRAVVSRLQEGPAPATRARRREPTDRDRRPAGTTGIALLESHRPQKGEASADQATPAADGTHERRPSLPARDVTTRLAAALRGGSALETGVRQRMESALGQSLAGVRVHRDAAAAEAARGMGATAFTVGRNVVLGRDAERAAPPNGDQTLAHELTHVIQHRRAVGPPSELVSSPTDAAELEASRVGWETARGLTPQPPRAEAGTLVLRQGHDEGGGTTPPAPPAPTTEEREAIDKARASKDVGDIKAIRNFGAASEPVRIEFLQILHNQDWVGPRDEWAMEAIWGSFGDGVVGRGLPDVAGENLGLWDACREDGAELEDLRPVVRLRQERLKADVTRVAGGHLTKNEEYVRAELKRYGLSAEEGVRIPDMPPLVPRPADDPQVKLLEETKRLAKQVIELQRWQEDLKRARVGKAAEAFNPARQPVEDFKIGELTSWELVKQGWDQAQELIARILNSNPALFAALQHGPEYLELISQGDPQKNPEAMLHNIRTNLVAVLHDVGVAKANLESGKADYRSLKPVHALLASGAASGIEPWSKPFYSWVMRNAVKGYEDKEYWLDLGLSIGAAALLIAAEFATLGGATFLVLTGAGIGASAFAAQRKEEKYSTLATAYGAQAAPGTGLVTKEQVDSAEVAAQMAKIELIVNVAGAGFSAAARAAAAQKGGGLPGGPKEGEPGFLRPATAGPGGAGQPGWTRAQIDQISQRTISGRQALKTVSEGRVNVVQGTGRQAAYTVENNTIMIGDGFTAEEAALAFIHEANHAEYALKGLTGNPLRMGQREYVFQMCREEAIGQAKTIRAKFELKAGQPSFAGETAAERIYGDAFAAEVQRLRAAEPGLPDFVLKSRGWDAGANALEAAFLDGRITTPTAAGDVSYVKFYGDQWVRARALAP
jgi:Domain of unknown function (DUF4157)